MMVNRTYLVTALVAVSLALLPVADAFVCHCPVDCDSCAEAKEASPAETGVNHGNTVLFDTHDCCGAPVPLSVAHSECSKDLMGSTVCLCQSGLQYFIHNSRDARHSHTAGAPDGLAISHGCPAILGSDTSPASLAGLFSRNDIPPHLLHCVFLC